MIDDNENSKIDFVFIGGWRLTATVDDQGNFAVEVSNEQGTPILAEEGDNGRNSPIYEWYFNLKTDENEEV